MSNWKWFVYILECLDGTYYTGMTWNVANRFEQHISRFGSKYTGQKGVKGLVYFEEFEDLEGARLREIQIKKWSKEKKKKLISGQWGKDW